MPNTIETATQSLYLFSQQELTQKTKDKVSKFQEFVRSNPSDPTYQLLLECLQQYQNNLKEWHPHYDFDLWDKAEIHFGQLWPQLRKVLHLAIEYGLYKEVKELFFEIRHLLQATGLTQDRIYLASWLRRLASERCDFGTMYLAISSLVWSYTSSGCHHDLDKASELWECLSSFLAEMSDPQKNSQVRNNLIERLGKSLYAELIIDIYENGARLSVRRKNFDDVTHYVKTGKEEISFLAQMEFISPRLKERFDIAFSYHEGVASYIKGEYSKSQEIFDDIIYRSRLIGWNRVVKGAKSWLATLAMQCNEYDICEEILAEILENESIQTNKRDGICHLIKAQLSDKRGKIGEKKASEKEAIKIFERLLELDINSQGSCSLNSIGLLSSFHVQLS
jgi:hypothetical protein